MLPLFKLNENVGSEDSLGSENRRGEGESDFILYILLLQYSSCRSVEAPMEGQENNHSGSSCLHSLLGRVRTQLLLVLYFSILVHSDVSKKVGRLSETSCTVHLAL